MKILSKMTSLIIFLLIIFLITNNTQINTFASSSINANSRKIVNIAVLLYNLDDLYIQNLKQRLEDIQKENANKVRFTFFDGKNNEAIQNENLNSALNSNIDLLIADLVISKEDEVKDVIIKAKEKNVPLILFDIPPEIVSKIYKNYDKTAFVLRDEEKVGSIEGKILANLWNANKRVIDKNNDNIMQYVVLQGNSPIAVERTQKAVSTINDSGINTQQLQLINGYWSKEIAKESIESLFLKYGGEIEAIISNNDAMAIGAIEGLQKYGYNTGSNSNYIPVVGIDGIPEARDLVDKGLMAGTVIRDPSPLAKGIYTIGMNLINNVNPLENTNYKYIEGEIIIPIDANEYINKTNMP